MNELFLKAKRAIRFLFYKDISIVDQIRISKILDNEQLEQKDYIQELIWKFSSSLNLRESIQKDKKKEKDWDEIKKVVKKVQKSCKYY